jgi:hypothetical protein
MEWGWYKTKSLKAIEINEVWERIDKIIKKIHQTSLKEIFAQKLQGLVKLTTHTILKGY